MACPGPDATIRKRPITGDDKCGVEAQIEMRALIAVARQRSFTKAAAKLGVSQAALSQTIRQRETRRGVRLPTPRRAASRRPKRAGNSQPGTTGARRWAAHLQRHGAVDQRRLPARDLRMCLDGADPYRQRPSCTRPGRLVRPVFRRHLFYPSRRRSSAAFSLVVDALRYRARSAD